MYTSTRHHIQYRGYIGKQGWVFGLVFLFVLYLEHSIEFTAVSFEDIQRIARVILKLLSQA